MLRICLFVALLDDVGVSFIKKCIAAIEYRGEHIFTAIFTTFNFH